MEAALRSRLGHRPEQHLVPSADHTGCTPNDVSWVSGPPAADTRNRPPGVRSERNTMRVPSGDHAGCVSGAGEWVNCRG